jgi:uncharacterized protein
MHRFALLPGLLAVVRLGPSEPVPEWAFADGPFASVTRTGDELSVVCPETSVPSGSRAERGWRALKLEGPFPFDQVGVLASITGPLAAGGVSLFALSTFDTDYVLVKASRLDEALALLAAAGHVRVG